MMLTTELLRHYQRCSRQSFLDTYGEPVQRDRQNEFRLKLRKDRLARQQLILAEQTYHQPDFPKGDLVAGAKATLALMQLGVDCIYRGVLVAEVEEHGIFPTFHTPQSLPQPSIENLLSQRRVTRTKIQTPITLVSRPDLLIKQPGKSKFGDWVYVPTDVQLGKRPKPEYQTIAAYHAQLLADVQGVWPETVWLQLRNHKTYAVNLGYRVPQMQVLLEECIQMLLSGQEPEVFISRHRCNLCPWLSHCYSVAKSQQHLSLIAGVTPSRYKFLQELGLMTVESLANANPTQLRTGLGDGIANQLVQQAQSVLQNRAIFKEFPSSQELQVEDLQELQVEGVQELQVSALEVKNLSQVSNFSNFHTAHSIHSFQSPVELYFDIEAEPELELDYLLGVLVVDRLAKTETFHAFIAEKPDDEELVWHQFLDLVSACPDAPIYHFCDYEVQAVKRLAKCYATPRQLMQPLLSRFVDIHAWVTETVTLPVESYALKPIARWLGFEWQDPQASGSQSICWYDQWLETADRTLLDTILRYNEDDCRATYQVKDWLVNFLQDAVLSNGVGERNFTQSS